MASSTLAMPTSYHKPTPALRKSKLDSTQVRSEDELLKFFLHGSYDVQRGSTQTLSNTSPTIVEENNTEKSLCLNNDSDGIPSVNHEEKKGKSRCMFEETYMINISVKQPDTVPSSKQIDVRIEKTPSDLPSTNEKVDEDEVSSIFDEEDNDDLDSVVFNEITSSMSDTPATQLTLADMINKTLTTIPPTNDQGKKVSNNNQWIVEKSVEMKTIEEKKTPIEKKRITPTPTLTTNRAEDEKLFEYLDYLETKEESNVKIVSESNQ